MKTTTQFLIVILFWIISLPLMSQTLDFNEEHTSGVLTIKERDIDNQGGNCTGSISLPPGLISISYEKNTCSYAGIFTTGANGSTVTILSGVGYAFDNTYALSTDGIIYYQVIGGPYQADNVVFKINFSVDPSYTQASVTDGSAFITQNETVGGSATIGKDLKIGGDVQMKGIINASGIDVTSASIRDGAIISGQGLTTSSLYSGTTNLWDTYVNNGLTVYGPSNFCYGDVNVDREIHASEILSFQDHTTFEINATTGLGLNNSYFNMPYYGIASPSIGASGDLWISGNHAIRMFTAGNAIPRLTIDNSGNVGIGVNTSPLVYKLEVKGTIHAKEVIVDVNGALADYVFHPSYKLMPLYQVEQFVKTNSHLPEIPSAAEVTKNGLNMGEMQNKLLQKIEELTLYVIEQQKKIEELERKMR